MTVGTHPLPTELLRGSCTDGPMFCIAKWAFDVTDGFIWTALLLGFVFALFMSTQRFGRERSFAYASFTGLLGAIFLAVLTLMPWWVASIFIIAGLIGIASLLMSDR